MTIFKNDSMSIGVRIGYCDELIQFRDWKENKVFSEIEKAKLEQRIKTVRALLVGGPVHKGDALLHSRSECQSYANKMLEQYKTELEPLKKAKLKHEFKRFLAVQEAYFAYNRSVVGSFTLAVQRDKFNELAALEKNQALKDDVMERANQLSTAFDLNKAGELVDQLKKLGEKRQAQIDLISPIIDEYRDQISEKVREIRQAQYSVDLDGMSSEEIRQHHDKYDKLIQDEYAKIKAKKHELDGENLAKYNAAVDEVNAQKIAMAQAFKDKAISMGSVTEQDAEEWIAKSVTITEAVKKKMKRHKITPEKFHQDLKDFYRLTNGRLGRVVINTKNHDRAYASGVGRHTAVAEVMLDNEFSQAVLWHELAHHLETDPMLMSLSGEYIKSRSIDGGKVHRLKNLTGISYRASEVAYKTDMFNHYAAKIYDDGITELYSMGVEQFYNPSKLFNVLITDPATLEFVGGVMTTPKTAMDDLNKYMADRVHELIGEAGKDHTENLESLVKQLANVVTWTEGTDFSFDQLLDEDRRILVNRYEAVPYGTATLPNGHKFVILKGKKVKYRGFRGRAMKGFIALDWTNYEKDVEGKNYSHFVVGSSMQLNFSFPIQTQEVEKAKVMLLGWDINRDSYVTDTKGVIGQDFLSGKLLKILETKYLKGE